MPKKWKPPYKFYIVLYLMCLFLGIQFASVIDKGDIFFDDVNKYLSLLENHFWDGIRWNPPYTIMSVFVVTFMVFIYIVLDITKERNFMPGKEYGTAKWANIDAINKRFKDKIPHQNRIYSNSLRISMDSKKTRINNNAFVVGGSGAGKSLFALTPNIFQADMDSKYPGSYVFTDPKGELLQKNGAYLKSIGYKIKVLNLTTDGMAESDCYNPFEYIRKISDIDKLIANLIANTTDKNASKGDPFWEKAESMLLQALFIYVWMESDRYGLEKNLNTVIDLLNEADVDDNGNESPLDKRFAQLVEDTKGSVKGGVRHPAYIKYKKCMKGAGDTVRSIIISANARMSIFENEEVRRLLEKDELDLVSIGSGLVDGKENVKTALFLVIPDSDDTYNCIAGMLYTQLFQELYAYADAPKQKGELPVPVTFWLDEFANISMPENFTKILATCRSRLISIVIIVQNLAQIKKLYEKDWEVIPGNCDVLLYLGGNEQSTWKYVSENLGKCTIWKRSRGKTFGKNGSNSKNEDVLGRELMTIEQVREMNNDKCIVFVRGQPPIFDDKYKTFAAPEFSKAKSLGIYEHNREKKFSNSNIRPISKKEFERISKKGKTAHIVLTDEGLFDAINGRKLSEEEWERMRSEHEERTDIAEGDEFKVSIDITDISLEELMYLPDFILPEDQIMEITQGVANGLTDEQIKSYILLGDAALMRIKRITLEAFNKRKEVG